VGATAIFRSPESGWFRKAPVFAVKLPSKNSARPHLCSAKNLHAEFVCIELSIGCCGYELAAGGHAQIARFACNYLRPLFVFVLAFVL
jgi:hypothetical protein